MKEPSEWREDDLHELIADQHEENVRLDYKASLALGKTEGQKAEISKDVSAFANSIGGTILYGMDEDPTPPNCATRLSPLNPTEISKEWLEHVINSRIQPRISGIRIHPIELRKSNPGLYAYAVVIPEGTTAHQASDKRYYKRFNFESVPMEDYEIRQTMNRASRPAYKVDLKTRPLPEIGGGRQGFRFVATLENQSAMVGRDVSAVLFAPVGLFLPKRPAQDEVNGMKFVRIAASYSHNVLSAIRAAHPLTWYEVNFTDTDFAWPRGSGSATLVVKVFDQFGLSCSTRFRLTDQSCMPVPDRVIWSVSVDPTRLTETDLA